MDFVTTRTEAAHLREHLEQDALALIREEPSYSGLFTVVSNTSEGLAAKVNWFENGVWLGSVPVDLEHAMDITRKLARMKLFVDLGLA